MSKTRCNVCNGIGAVTDTDMFGVTSYQKCPVCEAHKHFKKMFEMELIANG